MRKLRYTVRDTDTGAYLAEAEILLPGIMASTWTRHRDKAQRFPGVKSARNMADRLGGNGALEIYNGKGERIECCGRT